jgi:MFS family permease
MWGDLLGPAMFALLMGLGRVLYGFWGARLRLQRVLALSGGLCVACYLGITLVPSPLASLLFCALCGLSVSLMWPGSFSLASRRFPLGSTALFATLALAGDFGCSLGPWIAGLAADAASSGDGFLRRAASLLPAGESGLSVGILTAIVFPAVLLIVTLAISRDKTADSDSQG